MLEMRTSERQTLRDCPQRWWWAQVEGLVPNRTANALWFGTAIHAGLADWYQKGTARGPHPAGTFLGALEGDRKMIVTNEDEEREFVDAREMGVDMLNRYVDTYGEDSQWEFVGTERPFRIILPRAERTVFGVTLPRLSRWLRYVGTWDGVYRDRGTGELWILENKTAASIRVDHLPLDDQAGSYPALAEPVLRKAGVLGPKEEIAGINYNFLRKAIGDNRPKNERGLYTNKPTKQHYVDALRNAGYQGSDIDKMTAAKLEEVASAQNLLVLGEESKSQPPNYFERFPVYRSRGEKRRMIQRIQDDAFYDEAYRNGDLPVIKKPGRDKCSFCQFKALCQLDETGDQYAVEEMKQVAFTVLNPYAEHEKKSA